MVPVIEHFPMLRFCEGFLLKVKGLLYCIHKICGGISGVCTTWCLVLIVGTHEWCILIGERILLGIFHWARRLVFTLWFLSVFVLVPFSHPVFVKTLENFLLQDVGPPSLLYGDMWSQAFRFYPNRPFGENNTLQCQFSR